MFVLSFVYCVLWSSVISSHVGLLFRLLLSALPLNHFIIIFFYFQAIKSCFFTLYKINTKDMKHHIYLLFLLFGHIVQAQTSQWEYPEKDKRDFRICFYNLENLFDYEDDSLKNDDAFTPEGSYR